MKRLTLMLAAVTVLLLMGCDQLPAQISSADNLLYSDSFTPGESGRWRIDGDAVAWSAMMDSQLIISVSEPQLVQYATLDNRQFDDFVYEVDALFLDGDAANSYGVLFRMVGPDQFYRFELTGNGFFTVERHDGAGDWTRLIPAWEESSAINQGSGASNRLRVAASGDQLKFAINGQIVAELQDSAYARGSIGLDAGTFSRAGVQVAFDNLVVLRP